MFASEKGHTTLMKTLLDLKASVDVGFAVCFHSLAWAQVVLLFDYLSSDWGRL
jgi:hypothetical protein